MCTWLSLPLFLSPILHTSIPFYVHPPSLPPSLLPALPPSRRQEPGCTRACTLLNVPRTRACLLTASHCLSPFRSLYHYSLLLLFTTALYYYSLPCLCNCHYVSPSRRPALPQPLCAFRVFEETPWNSKKRVCRLPPVRERVVCYYFAGVEADVEHIYWYWCLVFMRVWVWVWVDVSVGAIFYFGVSSCLSLSVFCVCLCLLNTAACSNARHCAHTHAPTHTQVPGAGGSAAGSGQVSL